MSYEKQEQMAKALLEGRNHIIAVEKVTRAGATTSLIKEAVNAKMKVVFCAPTHKIGEDTVKQAVNFSQRKDARILYVKSNGEMCSKLSIMLGRNPRLRKMKWLMLPEKCTECEFNNPECELQNILLSENWDIIVITYQKLKALINSKEHSETSEILLSKLSGADVMIVDEYTQGLLGLTPSLELRLEEQDRLSNLFLETWSDVLVPLLEINMEILEVGLELKRGEGKAVENPLSEATLNFLRVNSRGLWNKLMNLTGRGYDTEFLQGLSGIVFSRKFFIYKNVKDHVALRPLEPLEEGLSFINNFVDNFASKGKLSLLVDSHLPDINLEELFGSPFAKVSWGDPNNTNSYIGYFCDTKTLNFHSFRFPSTQRYFQQTITAICDYHKTKSAKGLSEVLIVCMNKAMQSYVIQWKNAGLIPDIPNDNITYYRSKLTRGIPFDGKVQILLCGPYIPLAAYYHKTKLTEGEISNAEAWDYAFRKSSMGSDFINASTRVKDPEGRRDSFIYCLGMTKQEVESFLDVKCEMYHNGTAQPPFIISSLTTGIKGDDFIQATSLFEDRKETANPRIDIPFLIKLQKAKKYYLSKGQTEPVPLSQIFRDKTAEAVVVFNKNETWLNKSGIGLKTHSTGGLSLVIQDNNKLLLDNIAGSCCLEDCLEI
jgi:hypothetical protein